MSDLSVCRVCLKGNTKTYSVVNSPLHVMYENLTNNKLIIDGRPSTVCSICLWNLKNCYKLKEKSEKSGEILKQLSSHGIEILPETLSVMKQQIQHDYCVTVVDSCTYGCPYGNIVVKKEIKTELEPDLNPTVEDLGPDAKLCRVCLAVSTRTYSKLGKLQVLYDKITDSKLSAIPSDLIICYLCYARLQRCREIASKASKSEKILSELARNGIQLSRETVNILNRKIVNRFTKSPVKTFSYNPNDTTSDILKDGKGTAVETISKTIIIKQERDRYEEFDDLESSEVFGQSGDKPGQNVDAPGRNGDEIGQNGDESDQNSDKSEQNSDKSEQNSDKSDKSGDDSEKSADEPDPSEDDVEPSGDEPDQDDDSDQSDKADLNCGDIGDNCKVCKAKLDTLEKVERHKRLHDPKRKYACNKCTYRYAIISHLNFHKKTHKYNMKCKVCGKSFTHIRLLQRHMWLHNGNVYKCRICNAIFRYGYEISKHYLTEHPEVNFDCRFCKKAFTAEHRLFEHVFNDHARDFPYYTCDYCRKKYTDRPTLKRHMILVHLKSFKHKCGKCRQHFSKSAALEAHKKICYKKEEIVYKCDSCPKSYLNKYSLIRHEIIHTGERNFKCEICDKAFRDKYAIKTHMKCHNKDSRRLNCDFCEKTYINKHSYQEHVMTHMTGIKKPYSCDECFMNFATKYQLSKHKTKHSANPKEKQRYECKICNKKFVCLADHMKVHSENKPFGCDICDKAFRHKYNLITHKKYHNKEKPFVCDLCGKTFARKGHIENHILSIHTERVKAHLCKHCDKAFATAVQLKVHMRSHTGEKPFKCDKCHKKFCELRGLRLHDIREHTNVKKSKYICDLCHKVYLEKKDMIRHLKTHKGKRNFRCTVCGKLFLDMFCLFWHIKTHTKKSVEKLCCMFCKQTFSNQLILKRHYINSHDGYKEFACNICEEDFLSYQNLSVHIQSSHKEGYVCSLCKNIYKQQRNLLCHMIKVHGLKHKKYKR